MESLVSEQVNSPPHSQMPQGLVRRCAQNPLDLPEIITRIGQFLPLWSGEGFQREFEPLPLLRCALVSQAFRQALLPTLWYLYDGFRMRNVPHHILIKYSHLFRIISNTGPFKGPFRCKNLIELSTVYGQEWSRDLLVTNPGLKRLVWGGPYYRRIETLEQQQEWQLELTALMGLENLDVLKTSGFSLGEGIFVKVLRNNARLSNLALSTVEGVTSIEGLELPYLTELHIAFGGDESPALVDLVRCCPRLQKLSLTSSRARSSGMTTPHATNNQLSSSSLNITNNEFQIERLAQNIAQCCPELSSIKFTSNHTIGAASWPQIQSFLLDNEFAALVNACHRLESFSAEMITLDYALTEALVSQQRSLTSLSLTVHDSSLGLTVSDRARELHCLRRLKSSLEQLKELTLSWDKGLIALDIATAPADSATTTTSLLDEGIQEELEAFITEPWGCLDLMSLTVSGLVIGVSPSVSPSLSSSVAVVATIPIQVESVQDSLPTNGGSYDYSTFKASWRPQNQQHHSSNNHNHNDNNNSSSSSIVNLNCASQDDNEMTFSPLLPNIVSLRKLRHLCLDQKTFERIPMDA
ncbi:hypothetical protein BGZ80_004227 [Entomortierella chlamydospora]|uniref:Uncharacterized protein n=1 Tax=Entomortierella chlamydospora TaxID=101097 RepID=A0A9P6N1K6_9FUNG|nr:hypothetical protein BGZ79_006981 [Entomortierella chlamydospora]KAG0020416.1 hypothetical protein BGZ80_004227 [Entomortierella chlamydospora]